VEKTAAMKKIVTVNREAFIENFLPTFLALTSTILFIIIIFCFFLHVARVEIHYNDIAFLYLYAWHQRTHTDTYSKLLFAPQCFLNV
jgi:hypothetical protein